MSPLARVTNSTSIDDNNPEQNGWGVLVEDNANTITRNLIDGNANNGIAIGDDDFGDTSAPSSYNVVQKNTITDNGEIGVELSHGASHNLIGGSAGQGNYIHDNGGDGIKNEAESEPAVFNSFLSNSIEDNSFGISNDGNNPGDPGANNGIIPPDVTSAKTVGGKLYITGTYAGAAKAKIRIQLFASEGCDSSGWGQGDVYLGEKQIKTDKSGNGKFNVKIKSDITDGVVTVTATNVKTGDTSEFSYCDENASEIS